MRFTKMNGLGNDYIFIDTTKEYVDNPNWLSRRLSDRHRYIGADGLVLIGESQEADFSMRIFNADGSEGEMCGNALRCLGKYVYEKGLTAKTDLTVYTQAGIKKLALKVENDKVMCVKTNIGKPTIGHGDGVFAVDIEAYEKIYHGYQVAVGNPHYVIFVDSFFDEIMLVGQNISENTEYFPGRTNVEFVLSSTEKSVLTMRVYERGSGETLACGTGAAASFFVANRLNAVGAKATVKLPGGELKCELTEDDEIVLTGGAEYNFEGQI